MMENFMLHSVLLNCFTEWNYSWIAWVVFKNWKWTKKFWWLSRGVTKFENKPFFSQSPGQHLRRKQRFSENTDTHTCTPELLLLIKEGSLDCSLDQYRRNPQFKQLLILQELTQVFPSQWSPFQFRRELSACHYPYFCSHQAEQFPVLCRSVTSC